MHTTQTTSSTSEAPVLAERHPRRLALRAAGGVALVAGATVAVVTPPVLAMLSVNHNETLAHVPI